MDECRGTGQFGAPCELRWMLAMDERFAEPEPNLIESSAGFAVRVLGRTGITYTEGDRSAWIDSEVLAKPGPGSIALFADRIRGWQGPLGPVALTEADRTRIVQNVKRAFEACGYELQVHHDFDWL
jgi:hypothetical protein